MSSVDKPEAAAQTFSDFSKHIHILFNIDANKDDLIWQKNKKMSSHLCSPLDRRRLLLKILWYWSEKTFQAVTVWKYVFADTIAFLCQENASTSEQLSCVLLSSEYIHKIYTK